MPPDFILIGAMKCGTSTVCAYLEDHPDVFMLPNAEPNFFSYDENWEKGRGWYDAYFAPGDGLRLRGEGSNEYANPARFPEAAARMASYKPDLKIVYMVRHPLERMRSAWIQRRVDQGDVAAPTLEEAIAREPEIYLDQSLYWKTLSLYRAYFPQDDIFVGFLEEMNRDQDAFFARLCDFLGVEPHAVQRGHVNPSANKRVPSPMFSLVRSLPGYRSVKRLTPSGLRRFLRTGIFSRPVSEVPKVPRLLPRHADLLREDAAAFLKACGKPSDYWDLSMLPAPRFVA